MSSLVFFDTNILLYADDRRSPAKQENAAHLFAKHLRENTAVVSLQVLQEYFVIATRKLGLDAVVAQQKAETIACAKVVCFSAPDVIAAIELHRLGNLSFWDALIVHAARISGATILYSEDLHAGARIGGVKVVNPFKSKTS